MPPHHARSRYLPLPLPFHSISAAAIVQRCPSSFSISKSPFSACVSSEKKLVRAKWRPATPSMSDMTKQRRQGESMATMEDRREWLNNREQGVSYSLSEMPLSMKKDLAEYGYWEPEIRAICDDVGHWLHQRLTLDSIDRILSSKQQAPAYPSPVDSRVLTMIGTHFLENVPQWYGLGVNLWKIASENSSNTSLRLCAAEYNGTIRFQATSRARKLVADAASKGIHWEFMTVHVNNLLLQEKRDEALMWAKKLVEATKADRIYIRQEDYPDISWPWKTWADALDPTDAEERRRALQYGVDVWDDPEACFLLAEDYGKGPKQWLEYITKGAMGGHLRSMQKLGLYHLNLAGWFESKRPVSNTLDSQVGFKWLELCTLFEEPRREAFLWAAMALLLRDHGDRAKGMEYLKRGLEQINSKVVSKAAKAADIEQALADKNAALAELDPLVDSWGVNYLSKTSSSGREQRITAETFFGFL